jgi:hypothetical protein
MNGTWQAWHRAEPSLSNYSATSPSDETPAGDEDRRATGTGGRQGPAGDKDRRTGEGTGYRRLELPFMTKSSGGSSMI